MGGRVQKIPENLKRALMLCNMIRDQTFTLWSIVLVFTGKRRCGKWVRKRMPESLGWALCPLAWVLWLLFSKYGIWSTTFRRRNSYNRLLLVVLVNLRQSRAREMMDKQKSKCLASFLMKPADVDSFWQGTFSCINESPFVQQFTETSDFG